MRISLRPFAALAALLLALCVASVAQAQPIISAFIGTPTATSKIGYFVLDFDDAGLTPETYAFGWNYEGTKTGADLIVALQDALTGANGFQQAGAESNFVTKLGYNGRSKFNDFGGNNSGDPNGYWNFWLGLDGANWTSSEFGVADITLSDTLIYKTNPFTGEESLAGASWLGGRWVKDFNTETAEAPRTPGIAVAAPEPATLGYEVLGAGCWVLGVRRKKAV